MVEVSTTDIEMKEAGYASGSWAAIWGWENYINYNLDAVSGDTTLLLEQSIPKNGKVRVANAYLEGSSHNGTLRNFSGTSVSQSAVEYSAATAGAVATAVAVGESNKAFVIDFGGIRKISALAVASEAESDMPQIVMVLPWMGIEFGEKPLFPFTEERILSTFDYYNVSFAEVETAKLFVQFASNVSIPSGGTVIDAVTDNLVINSATMPLNVRVAVGNQAAFHTHSGELKGKIPLPEFSKELNTYLDEIRKAGADDVDSVPLMITMDSPGVVKLDSFQIISDREVQAKWSESTRQSVNFERQAQQILDISFPASESTAWNIHGLEMEITHDFPEWRTFSRNLPQLDDKIAAKVTSDFNLAQCLVIDESTDLFGIGLYIAELKENAEVLIELLNDKNGQPDSVVLLEEQVKIEKNENSHWTEILFSKPYATTAGKDLWLVIKSKVGELPVVLHNNGGAEDKPILFNRNGAGYKQFPYKSGQVYAEHKIFRIPAIGEDAKIVSLELEGKTKESDLTEDINSLSFSYVDTESGVSNGPQITPVNGKVHLNLKITAHAKGSMTFQNVKTQFQLVT